MKFPAIIKSSVEDVVNGEVGSITFWSDNSKIAMQLPKCGGCVILRISQDKSHKSPEGPVWWWNGNKEKPTLHPSIRVMGEEEWHGYLRDGIFSAC